MFCPKCGTQNEDTASHCTKCQFALSQLNLAEKTELTQDELYQAVIGNKKQDVYLTHFAKFDHDGKTSATWHWPALFVPFYWFLYRKMWPHAIIYFIIPYVGALLIGMLAPILGESASGLIGVVYLIFIVALHLLPALFANALYYRHCKKKIAETVAKKLSTEKTIGELIGNGGTSGVVLIIVLVIAFVAIIGILAAIAIPQYQSYTMRAKLSQVLLQEKMASKAVEQYFMAHNAVPQSLAQAGFTPTPSPDIASFEINPKNGAIAVTLATPTLQGQHLLMIPAQDEHNQITWTCMSDDIKAYFLPTECRQPSQQP